jgi:tRNA modification GTPase
VLEVHAHGGAVVLELLLKRCGELGARIARPGEFTQRAFLNEKMDLAQAEGVIDLIDATTAQAARSAIRSLDGEFSRGIGKLAQELIELRMLAEATLDFPEEELAPLARSHIGERLESMRVALREVDEAARHGSLLREGLQVVLVGAPNVGKSSLLNRLAGEELAIVTEVPGTTRDAIRQTLSVGGVPMHVIDTAGVRQALDAVEGIGIERTWAAVAKADLALVVVDASDGAKDEAVLAKLPPALPRITVWNKIDLLPEEPAYVPEAHTVWLSAKTGAGVDLLKKALLEASGWHGEEGVFLARGRHLEALRGAAAHLRRAADLAGEMELMAEELRLAHSRLCQITGEYTADDLLGQIFSRFCIGK